MFVTVGCSASPVVSKVVFEDEDHVVRLDVTYRTGMQEHSHPAPLTSMELATVLRAIEVTPQRDLISGYLAPYTSDSPRAFSEEQVQFLAPLLAKGLNHATPLEEVVFYLNQPRDRNIREITSGSLYLHEQALHFILANYRWATAGRMEAERVKTNPLTILGKSRYHVSPGPHGSAQSRQSWLRIFSQTPQQLIIDYQALITSDSSTENRKSSEQPSDQSQPLAEKLQLLRELKDEGFLTEQEFQEKKKQILGRD